MVSGAPTSIDTMMGAFHPVYEGILGKLTLKDLIKIIDKHMVLCTQSHVSTVYALNYLDVCIPAVMWA